MLPVPCQCIAYGLQSSPALRLLQHKPTVRSLRTQMLLEPAGASNRSAQWLQSSKAMAGGGRLPFLSNSPCKVLYEGSYGQD